jgi:hypothetical protein
LLLRFTSPADANYNLNHGWFGACRGIDRHHAQE